MATSRRILVVEDDADGAATLAQYLALAGHDVRVAHDGHEGEKELGSYGPDVVILDLNLPGIDGWSLARRLRSNPAYAPQPLLIALSAYNDEEHLRRSREAGFDFHIAKPASPARLLELLEYGVGA